MRKDLETYEQREGAKLIQVIKRIQALEDTLKVSNPVRKWAIKGLSGYFEKDMRYLEFQKARIKKKGLRGMDQLDKWQDIINLIKRYNKARGEI